MKSVSCGLLAMCCFACGSGLPAPSTSSQGGAAGEPAVVSAGGENAGAGQAGGSSASASSCAGKTYKLCEDFESGTLGGVPNGWTSLKGFGSAQGVGLATDQVHSGKMALKSDSMNTGQARIQRSLAALGGTASTHFGRIFYKVQSPAPKPQSGVFHVTFTALEGSTENRVVDAVEDDSGAHQWLFNIPDDSCCAGSNYDWAFDDAWHCAEWYVNVSAQAYRFFTDGTEVPSLAFTGEPTAKMSEYTSIAVGSMFYQTPPAPFVVWFDDLAIDDRQIGCEK